MSPSRRGVPTLELRLAEIDRRLRTVQRDLRPDLPAGEHPSQPSAPQAPPAQQRPPAAPQPTEPPPEPAAKSAPEPAAEPAAGRRGPLANLLARDLRRRNVARGDIANELLRLVEINDQLLEVVRQLLPDNEADPGPLARETPAPSPTVAVAANPFSEIAAVRDFAAQLGELDSVQEVALRGYEGELGAVFEVRLSRSSA